MNKILYLEVDGLGIDENDNPCPTGLKIDFGCEWDSVHLLDELNKSVPLKETVLKLAFLDGICAAEDLKFISAEEYDKKYGEDAEDEDDIFEDFFDYEDDWDD